MGRPTRAFTLLEALIGGLIFVTILGALFYVMSGARRGSEVSALYLNLMESVALVVHQLRMDLRQLTFIPDRDIMPYSIVIKDTPDPGARSIRLRRSAPLAADAGPSAGPSTGPSFAAVGSSFIVVEYRLVPTDRKPDRFHLMRTEWTASGKPIPGKQVSRAERVYRSFTLKSASFLADPEPNPRVLHVAMEVVSDTGDVPNWGPFREKSMLVTNVLFIQKPEPTFHFLTSFFAQPMTHNLSSPMPPPPPPSPGQPPPPSPLPVEIPPTEIKAPVAQDAEGPPPDPP